MIGTTAERDRRSSPSGGPEPSPERSRVVGGRAPRDGGRTRRAGTWGLLALLMTASLVPRLPLLYNAGFAFSSDEAVNALVLKHLLRGELTAFNWDATYYGIAESLLALPFVAVLGFAPLAFKLAAFCGHLALMAAVFLLGRRLYGDGAGLVAAALLVFFSPQLVQWSTTAAVGYCLVVAWGTFTLLHLDRMLRGRAPRPVESGLTDAGPTGLDPADLSSAGLQMPIGGVGIAVLGLLVGFGLYIYELYLVYVALLAAGGVLWLLGRLLRGRAARRRASPLAGSSHVTAIALLAAGFALGWAPKLWLLAAGTAGSKRPSYGIAPSLDLLLANSRLLVGTCGPAFLGVNLWNGGGLRVAVGPAGPAARALGFVVVALYGAAWLWAARRVFHRWLGRHVDEGAGVEGLLVLLVPLDAALFVLSPNSQGVFANRFLLPWAGSLPLLAGGALAAAARRGRGIRLAAWAAGLWLVLYPAVQLARWYERNGDITADLRLVERHEPLREVIRYLDRQGIRGAYGGYWTAYKATLMSDERLIVAPVDGWDRYPAYTRQVDHLDRAAYIFRIDYDTLEPLMAVGMRQQRDDFLNRLESASRSYQVALVPPYVIYHGRSGARLLAPAVDLPPAPLARPRARIQAGPVPAALPAGSRLRVPVRLRNESDGHWSSLGIPLLAGTYRVAASYRWLDLAGNVVVDNGVRSLLPRDVRPGESLDMIVRVQAPEAPGTYQLAVTLVQENVAWFDQVPGNEVPRFRVEVSPRAAAPPAQAAPAVAARSQP